MKKKSTFKQLGKLLKEGLSSHQQDYSKAWKPKQPRKDSVDQAFDFLSLIQAWPEIIGPRLSQNTIPLKNTKRSLTILTNHPAYSEQLKFMEVQLLNKIKNRFPNLKDSLKTLYFKTDSTYFQKQKQISNERQGLGTNDEVRISQTFHKYSPEYRKLKSQADEEFKDIDSEEIKEHLTSIFIQSRQTD